MQEIKQILHETAESLRETQSITNSNARAIEANSNAIAESRAEIQKILAEFSIESRRSTEDFQTAIGQSFQNVMELIGAIVQQQQQNAQDIGNLRAIVQDWITQQQGGDN